MIQTAKKKIVLYQPKQVDDSLGVESSKDMLPLELLTISAFPLQDGYEIKIVDGSLYGGTGHFMNEILPLAVYLLDNIEQMDATAGM